MILLSVETTTANSIQTTNGGELEGNFASPYRRNIFKGIVEDKEEYVMGNERKNAPFFQKQDIGIIMSIPFLF